MGIVISHLFSSEEIVSILAQLGVTHVVWIPDTTLGVWESALDASPDFDLIRVCREGEAWPLAAGLNLGGKTPIVMMQTTGLFESGDALRNVVFDLKLPVVAIIGARNWLTPDSKDTAKTFAEPILAAWNLDYRIVATADDKRQLVESLETFMEAEQPGIVLLAE